MWFASHCVKEAEASSQRDIHRIQHNISQYSQQDKPISPVCPYLVIICLRLKMINFTEIHFRLNDGHARYQVYQLHSLEVVSQRPYWHLRYSVFQWIFVCIYVQITDFSWTSLTFKSK